MSSRAIVFISLILAVVFALFAGVTTVGLIMARNEVENLHERLDAVQEDNRLQEQALRYQAERSARQSAELGVFGGAAEERAREGTVHRDLAVTLLDRIDSRLELMTDVARWKWNAKRPIDDPEREQELLSRIVAQAREKGVEPAFAAAFFRDQIEAAKSRQRVLFAEWKDQGATSFEGVPDLQSDQRPKIDAATDALLDALAEIEPHRNDPAFRSAFAAAARERSLLVPPRVDRWNRAVLSLLPGS